MVGCSRPYWPQTLTGIAEFERALIQERICSGIAPAKPRGKQSAAEPGSGRTPTALRQRFWR
jgi:DNA invertase Pin-like site-specific DNA recombinase